MTQHRPEPDLLTVAAGWADLAGWPVALRFDLGPRHVHQVTNLGVDPAVSVHLYRPALPRMTRYHLVDGRLRVAEVAEAGRSW
ncbi:hypothetical protein KBX71_15485 [Micromonospora sp. D93]|uniref:hypothetical protein n=1 Tax=Micromonospora sp. D93 TaxID=2824886 RepID=UPI001B38DDA9|nr:hypothetical protein [Micromonospora sp. D93]MBQ1019259.1 hypothetical protein [Micromonospora sp. D93]